MPRVKMLKSIAHNVAHSYLSLMDYIDGEYTVERLFQIAKETKQTILLIDILNQSIEPPIYRTPAIIQSLIYLKNSFDRLLYSEKIPHEFIRSAIIKISFDLDKTSINPNVSDLELACYQCNSEIIDINGKTYSKDVVEWWRY